MEKLVLLYKQFDVLLAKILAWIHWLSRWQWDTFINLCSLFAKQNCYIVSLGMSEFFLHIRTIVICAEESAKRFWLRGFNKVFCKMLNWSRLHYSKLAIPNSFPNSDLTQHYCNQTRLSSTFYWTLYSNPSVIANWRSIPWHFHFINEPLYWWHPYFTSVITQKREFLQGPYTYNGWRFLIT